MRSLPMSAFAAFLLACACSQTPASDHDGNSSSAGHAPQDGGLFQGKASVPANDAPFGMAMGAPATGFSIDAGQSHPEQGSYLLTRVPKPAPGFESYVAVAYPETGLCAIVGIGSTNANDPSGSAGRSQVASLADALSSKYGEGEKIDTCQGYACESENWTMRINDHTRAYGYHWEGKNGKTLPQQVTQIDLELLASGLDNTYVRLGYRFDNQIACRAAARKVRASNL